MKITFKINTGTYQSKPVKIISSFDGEREFGYLALFNIQDSNITITNEYFENIFLSRKCRSLDIAKSIISNFITERH